MPDEPVVREFMSSPAASLQRGNCLLDALLLIRRTGFRHIPVLDGDTIIGVVTERDVGRSAPSLLGKLSQQEYNDIYEKTPLEKIMSRTPISVSPATSMLKAVTILYENKFGCLPVVDGGRLVGILTVTDVLGFLVRQLGGNPSAQVPVEKS